MKYSIMILAPLMMIMAVLNILLNHQHLLMSLLSLEVMILGILLIFSTMDLNFSSSEMVCVLILLTMGACEASLGLACLVMMTRSHGNDRLTSLSLVKC